MPINDFILDVISQMLRSLLLETVSKRFLNARWPRKLRGMTALRQHIHIQVRKRLFRRLSTEAA